MAAATHQHTLPQQNAAMGSHKQVVIGFDLAAQPMASSSSSGGAAQRSGSGSGAASATGGDDDDAEMKDAEGIQPLPIPGANNAHLAPSSLSSSSYHSPRSETTAATTAMLPTPPDGASGAAAASTCSSSSSRGGGKSNKRSDAATIAYPPLAVLKPPAVAAATPPPPTPPPVAEHGDARSRGQTRAPQSGGGGSSSSWGAYAGSYGSSGAYRSTSFQTSAERDERRRGGGGAGTRERDPDWEAEHELMDDDVDDDDDNREDDDDNGARGDGNYDHLIFDDDLQQQQQLSHRVPQQVRELVDMMEDENEDHDHDHDRDHNSAGGRSTADAGGVFSFSSPYLQAQAPPPMQYAHAQSVLSPSWTAASLSRMSLSGSPDPAGSSAGRRHHLLSSSVPSGARCYTNAHGGTIPLHAFRRPSSGAARGANMAHSSSFDGSAGAGAGWPAPTAGASSPCDAEYHPYARRSAGAGGAKSRSRSRNRTLLASTLEPRGGVGGARVFGSPLSSSQYSRSLSTPRDILADDDEETDDEMPVVQGIDPDADATEDEADRHVMLVPGSAGFGARRAVYGPTSRNNSNNNGTGTSAGNYRLRRGERDSPSASSVGVGPGTMSLGLLLSPGSPSFPGSLSSSSSGGGGVNDGYHPHHHVAGERSPRQVSLGRQYASDRHHPPSSAGQVLSVNRHHPYASSPIAAGAAGPLAIALGGSPGAGGSSASAGAGAPSYSPSATAMAGGGVMAGANSARPMHRRGSSLSNHAPTMFGFPGSSPSSAAPAGPYGISPGATGATALPLLSQSPRYGGLPTLSTRELPPGVYSDATPVKEPPVGSFTSSHSRSPHGRVGRHVQPRVEEVLSSKSEDDVETDEDEDEDEDEMEDDADDREGDQEAFAAEDDMQKDADAGATTRRTRRATVAAAAAANPSQAGRSSSRPRHKPARIGTSTLERGMDEAMQVAAIRDRLGGAANCSAFISKLWYLMISPDLYAQYIHWSESGDAIVMSNDADLANEFAADVLPKLFKHGNNASFVRQLNLYGFQRISSTRPLDATELKVAKARGINVNGTGHAAASAQTLYGSHSSFTHPRFQRDMETLLPSMKPRSSKKPKRATASAAGAGANGEKGDSDGEDE